MGDLPPTEADADLDLVAVLQELDGVAEFGLNVVFLDGGGKLHLFERYDALIFAQVALPLGLLVAVLVVVHQLTDRGLSVCCDLYQIQTGLFGHFQRLTGGHNAQLFAVGGNQPYLSVADFFVDHRLVDVDAPPNGCWFLRSGLLGNKKRRAQTTRRKHPMDLCAMTDATSLRGEKRAASSYKSKYNTSVSDCQAVK